MPGRQAAAVSLDSNVEELKAERAARRREREQRFAAKNPDLFMEPKSQSTSSRSLPNKSRQLQAKLERQKELEAAGTDINDPLYVLTVHYGPMPAVCLAIQ